MDDPSYVGAIEDAADTGAGNMQTTKIAEKSKVLQCLVEYLRNGKQDVTDLNGRYPSYGWLSDGRGTIFSDDENILTETADAVMQKLGKPSDWIDYQGPSYCLDGIGTEADWPFQCFAQAVYEMHTGQASLATRKLNVAQAKVFEKVRDAVAFVVAEEV